MLEYVKAHPYTVAGVVAGGLILYLVYSSVSSSSGATYAAGPSDAQIQAGMALQSQQFQLAAHSADLSAGLAAATIAANRDQALKDYDYRLGVYQTGVGANVSLSGIDAQKTIQLAGITAQEQIAQGAQDTQRAQINATRDIAAASDATMQAIAGFNADTVRASYAANAAISISHDDRDVAMNLAQQKTARKQSDNNLFGNILGGALAIFGL